MANTRVRVMDQLQAVALATRFLICHVPDADFREVWARLDEGRWWISFGVGLIVTFRIKKTEHLVAADPAAISATRDITAPKAARQPSMLFCREARHDVV